MKKNIFIYLMMAMFSLVLMSCNTKTDDNAQDNATQINYDEVLYNIVFPQYGGVHKENIIFNDEMGEIENEECLNKAYVIDEKGNEPIVEKLKKKLNLNDEQVVGEMGSPSEEEFVRVYNNGYIDYTKCELFNPDQPDKAVELQLTDKELNDIANGFLREIGALDDTMKITSYTEDKIENLTTHEEITIAKTVNYTKYIDGVEVYAPFAASIRIDGNGEIVKCYIPNLNIKEEIEIDDSYIVGEDEAYTQATKLQGKTAVNEVVDEITISDAKVMFWAEAYPYSEERAIIPVYKLEGKSYVNGKEYGKALFYESAIKVEE